MKDIEALTKIIEILKTLTPCERFRIVDWLQCLEQNEWNDEIVFGDEKKK